MVPEQTFKLNHQRDQTVSHMICNAIQDCRIPVIQVNTEYYFKVASGIDIDCMKGQVLMYLSSHQSETVNGFLRKQIPFTTCATVLYFVCTKMNQVNERCKLPP